MLDEAPARLREERKRLGLNQPDFGKLGNVSKNTQLAYESGASPIPLDYLGRLAEHGVDPGYIVCGVRSDAGDRGSGASDRRMAYRPEPLQEERLLPRRSDPDIVEIAGIDLNFGLGAAFMDQDVVEHQADRLQFPSSWIRQITTAPADQLYWTRGVGNSMEPTINDGDVILIDRSKTGSTFGDLYWAIAYGQTGMIKRLRPMPDGSVKILSDNPAVPPETAYDGELHVFGRVVAVVKKI